MKWTEAYATGIERIDEQHKMLFSMSEDYRTALDEGHGERVYGSFLRSLDLYAQAHFRFEEGCMEACRCPAAQVNRQAHDGFVAFVKRFTERHDSDAFDISDAQALTDTLDRWLSDHICRIDLQLRDWIDRPPGSAAPGDAEWPPDPSQPVP